MNTRADGGVKLWLADVAGAAGWQWPVPCLARFAYELGVAQSRWAGRLPDHPWLSRRWLSQYLAEGPPRLDDAHWDHPSVAVWPANLVDQDQTSVLFDWSFTGDGAVGEDVADLIIDSCTDGLMDVGLLLEIEQSAADCYLHGLREGGWTGSADAVRTTIAACGAAKYSWFAPAVAGRAARDRISQSSYGQDTSAAAAPGGRAGHPDRRLGRGRSRLTTAFGQSQVSHRDL